MPYVPQVSTVIDAFNRANGTVQAGAGSTIWDTVHWGGAAADWNVVSNHAEPGGSGKGVQSLFTLPDDKEIIFDLGPIPGSGYIALFFDIQDGSNAHWLIIEIGNSWALKKDVAGSVSTLQSVSWASAPTIANVDKVSIYQVDGVIRVRYMLSGAWVETPILEQSSAALGATGKVALEATGVWGVDNLLGGAAIAEVGGGGGGGDPTEAVTIYVNGDAGDDSRSRLTASDQSTPVATLQRAATLAFATDTFADTIGVFAADAADAANTIDPSVYAPMHHKWTGGDVLPFGDNTGNLPITVVGIQGNLPANEWDKIPKILPPQGQFKNWVWMSDSPSDHKAFQVGYDVGSGDDNLTIGSLTLVEDLEFHDMLFTGGGYDIRGWNNILFDGCWVRSPLSAFQGSGNRFLDGAGFHLSYIDNSTLAEMVGPVRWTNCVFDTINGEDALQLYGGGVGGTYAASAVEVDHCLFIDVLGQAGFHTDSIQVLGGTSFYVHDNVFIGCDDVLLATDSHNGTIRFENNLMSGCGLPVQIQGTDNIIFRHNTSVGSFFRTTLIVFERFTLPAPPTLVMVNNLLEDYDIQVTIDADSILTPNLVTGNVGKNGNLTGLPELGTSARMSDLPTSSVARPVLPANYELANTPTSSPGIGQGVALNSGNGGVLATDRLGRAYTSPPDVGCHQSSGATAVAPAPRAPYVLDFHPVSAAANAPVDVSVTARFFPKPGEQINASTVTTSSAYVTDSRGNVIPAVVSLSSPSSGYQTVTIDMKSSLSPITDGDLYPLASYTAHLTGTIADTEGSVISPTTWSFQVVGPVGPAIGVASSGAWSTGVVT